MNVTVFLIMNAIYKPNLVFGVLIFLCLSCVSSTKKVTEVARNEISKREIWTNDIDIVVSPKKSNIWSVTVWRLPYTPGGHRYLKISEDYKVIDYGY